MGMRFQKSDLVPIAARALTRLSHCAAGDRRTPQKIVIAGTFIDCLYLLAIQDKEIETP